VAKSRVLDPATVLAHLRENIETLCARFFPPSLRCPKRKQNKKKGRTTRLRADDDDDVTIKNDKATHASSSTQLWRSAAHPPDAAYDCLPLHCHLHDATTAAAELRAITIAKITKKGGNDDEDDEIDKNADTEKKYYISPPAALHLVFPAWEENLAFLESQTPESLCAAWRNIEAEKERYLLSREDIDVDADNDILRGAAPESTTEATCTVVAALDFFSKNIQSILLRDHTCAS
jgi:hypothetical protein